MKKLVLMLAAVAMTASASAQVLESAPGQEYGLRQSKFCDNWYVGVNGGVATKLTGHKWLSDLDPNAGIRVGKQLTPVFGLAAESNAYFSNKPWTSTKTVVRALNTSLLGTFNLSNLFAGYKGDPRFFEVSAVYGLGWGHVFNKDYKHDMNRMTSKAGVDFQFNLGKNKEWQVYVEPSVTWAFNGKNDFNQESEKMFNGNNELNYVDFNHKSVASAAQPNYNIHNAYLQLNAGVIYKFKNHDGRHNFSLVRFRDQSEIDGLNDQINNLKAELAKKPKEVVKEVVKETPVKEINVSDLVFVTFAQGKSALTKEAKKALDGIASGKHVSIIGTASPEGSKAINDKLSQDRANSVAEYLKSKGVSVDEATGKGVQGNTSNRLAVVYVK
ncbi:OmpA family protein [uncultured Prevotella sp.]|uniref:OmpA family protein n=1 Tax=uncultured Prevotella sp. TaxID=159272 RepID=UPI0025955A32|nr:OmpA family protein [uncultured Prevotella sp.]